MSIGATRWRPALAFLIAGTVAGALPSHAQTHLATVPRRDAVELTIYRDHDLTVARERRTVTLRKGTNLIPFSWVGTRIDPTSVQLRFVEGPADVRLVETVVPPRLPNTVVFRVASEQTRAQDVEVSYFLQGLSWGARYVAYVDASESEMRLAGYFTVSNESGEDFEKAAARLVVGEIHLLPPPVSEAKQMLQDAAKRGELAGRALQRAAAAPAREQAARAEALAEYYAYALEGAHDFENTWSRKVLALAAEGAPLKVVYRHDGAVRRLYTFSNSAPPGRDDGLGVEPLPAGPVDVFSMDEKGNVSFVGRAALEFTSVGKEAKLDLGPEPSVTVERKVMDFRRLSISFREDGNVAGAEVEEEVRLEARNLRPEKVRLELPQQVGDQWDILSSSVPYERKDARTIQFTLELGAGETQAVTYRVRRREG
jgi:hypothetical protein